MHYLLWTLIAFISGAIPYAWIIGRLAGGGVPMVTLSGKVASQLLLEDES